MDWILSGAILLGIGVTLLCIVLHKGAETDDNKDYESFLDEDNDHLYYDKTSIRYKKGWKGNRTGRKE